MFDVGAVEGLLRAAAGRGEVLSYSETLMQLGVRFSRPRMRALCRVLDAIDRQARAAGEPELAVLVVRESDGLPGQGWWITRRRTGAWEGPAARARVAALQALAFAHWEGWEP